MLRQAAQPSHSDGMQTSRILQVTGLTLLAVGAASVLATLLVRDQMSRHRRDLFSAHTLRRLAALGFMGQEDASVDAVLLLRDYLAWEPHALLRKRAQGVLARMERDLAAASALAEGA
jgi:hypothetical protein